MTFAVVWVGGGTLLTILGDPGAAGVAIRARIVTIAQQAAFAGEKIFAPAGLVVFLMGIAMMINTDWGWGTFWIDAGLVGYAGDVHHAASPSCRRSRRRSRHRRSRTGRSIPRRSP